MGGLSFFLSNLTNLVSFLLRFLERVPVAMRPLQIEKMVSLVSRTGRDLQRYDQKGRRQVVGCVPYRYSKEKELEVLVISAQNGEGMLFPKGGWELDESIKEAALRETIEEAGVVGEIKDKLLGVWEYKSKRSGLLHEVCMFPLLASKLLDHWPEANIRKRRWVKADEAREVCKTWWMKEALDELILRQREKEHKGSSHSI